MIKPTYLWALCKTCDDSKWIGDICRYLGGQQVNLDFGQRQVAEMIKMDSEWMDERISWNREAARMRQARARERKNAERAAENEDTALMGDTETNSDASLRVTPKSRHVTRSHADVTPSIHPSIHPYKDHALSSVKNAPARARIEPDFLRNAAAQLGIPREFADEFAEIMRTQDWAYINPNGRTVAVNLGNVKTVMGCFWKRERDRRAEAGGGCDPSAPMSDETRRILAKTRK